MSTNKIFEEFIKANPTFQNPAGHHRRLADFSYDAKYRSRVAEGSMTYVDALAAARDDALEIMPIPDEKPLNISAYQGADRVIADMALSRNQPVPPASGRSEAPTGNVAAICGRYAGSKSEGDPNA